jgi:methylmalonyl-CoA mutase N-terminal domain/subunit
VGVNEFGVGEEEPPAILRIDEGTRKKQVQKLNEIKLARDQKQVARSLQQLRTTARTNDNLVPHILTAVESYATVGEISDALRSVWGEYEK